MSNFITHASPLKSPSPPSSLISSSSFFKSQKVPKSPSFSVIIINYNSSQLLYQAVRTFCAAHLNCSLTFEFVIIDNCSSVVQKKLLEKKCASLNQEFSASLPFFSLQLFSSHQNLGFGAANNLAAARSRGEYLLFLNPDTLTSMDILSSLYSALNQKHSGLVAPTLILPSGEPQPFSFGALPTLSNTIFAKIFPLLPSSFSRSVPPVEWLSGACFALRRSHFDYLRGFSPDFFMYFEDVDFCARAITSGLSVSLLPDVSITHLGGARSRLTRARRRQYFQAQKQYFRRHHPFQLPLLLFLRLPYQLFCFLKDSP